MHPDRPGAQPSGSRRDVLRFRQRVELVVVRKVGLELETARLVPDENRRVAYIRREPLAAANRGAEEVVEIRTIPGQPGAPMAVAILEVEMVTFVARQTVLRRVGRSDADLGELERIFDIDAVAK